MKIAVYSIIKLVRFCPYLLLIPIISCTTTNTVNTNNGLDISLKQPSSQTIKSDVNKLTTIAAEGTNTSKTKDDNKVDPKKEADTNLVLKWQQHFKKKPSKSERKLLVSKLEKWKETDNIKDLIAKARTYSAVGQISQAEASYRKALRKDSNNKTALLEISQVYLRKREIEKCFDYLTHLRKLLTPEDTSTQFKFQYKYTLALALLARKDRSKGIRILSDLIKHAKDFSPAYAVLASIYIKQNKFNVAKFIVKRGVDRTGDDPRLINILAVIALKNRKYNEARRWIDKALKLDPRFAPALLNRANLGIMNHEYESAEKDLKKTISISPSYTQAYVLTGILYKRTGLFERAEQYFRKAIDLDPESAYARFNLGVLMAENLKSPNRALRLFHEVVQTKDNDGNLKNLAKLHIESIRENKLTN